MPIDAHSHESIVRACIELERYTRDDPVSRARITGGLGIASAVLGNIALYSAFGEITSPNEAEASIMLGAAFFASSAVATLEMVLKPTLNTAHRYSRNIRDFVRKAINYKPDDYDGF